MNNIGFLFIFFLAATTSAGKSYAQSNYTDEYIGMTVFAGLGTVQQSRGKVCGTYAEWDSSEVPVPSLGPLVGVRVACLEEGYSAESNGPETLVELEFGNFETIPIQLPGISYDRIDIDQDAVGAPLTVSIVVASTTSIHGFSVPMIAISADTPNGSSEIIVPTSLAWWEQGQCIFDGGDRPWVQALFEVQNYDSIARRVTEAYTTGILQGAEFEPLIDCGSTHCVADMDNRGTDTSIFQLAAEAMSWTGVECVASRYNEEDQPPLMIARIAHGTFGMDSLNFRKVANYRLNEIVEGIFSDPRIKFSNLFPMPNRGYRFSIVGPGNALPGIRSTDHWFQITIETELDTRPIGEEIEIRVSEIRRVRYPNDSATIEAAFFSQAQPMATEDPNTWVPTEIGVQVNDFLAFFVGQVNRQIDGQIIGLFQ